MKLLGKCFSWKPSSLTRSHYCSLVRQGQESPPSPTTTFSGCRERSMIGSLKNCSLVDIAKKLTLWRCFSLRHLLSLMCTPEVYWLLKQCMLLFSENLNIKRNVTSMFVNKKHRCYMACVCSRYNARSDWLLVGHSPVRSLWGNRQGLQVLVLDYPVKTSLLVNKYPGSY